MKLIKMPAIFHG